MGIFNMVKVYKRGDEVWWHDPSDQASGHYIIESGNNDVEELRGDEVILIRTSNGISLIEALSNELRKLAREKDCPDCGWELYDEYHSQFKYWCSFCEKSLYGFEVD